MSILNLTYDTKEAIPAGYEALFTESNGKFQLTGIIGMKTGDDVARLQTALTSEREAHKATKDRLRPVHFKGRSVVEMNEADLKVAVEALDKYDELEASVGKIDDEKVNQLVEARLKTKLGPVERERDQWKEKATGYETEIGSYKQRENSRKIQDALLTAKSKSKFRDEAFDDIMLNGERMLQIDESGNVITRDAVGVTPGVAVDVWLTEMQPKRPHWWPESKGGGATGGGAGNGFGSNPFSADNWNLSEQGKVVREQGIEKATALAQSAGTTVGGPRPTAKK